MKRQPIDDLVDELDRLFRRRSSEQSSPETSGVQCGDDFAVSPVLRARRRKRRSALDKYKSVVDSFLIRRARSSRPELFTYLRLQKLIERKFSHRFSVSTLQRRLVRWGLAEGMRRYKK